MKWQYAKFWQVTRRIRNGLNVKQAQDAGGLPISRIETIWNQMIDTERVGYADVQEGTKTEWYLSRGEILFSHINSEERIGNSALYDGKPYPLIHGMNLLCITPDENLILSKFLLYFIRSKQFRQSLRPIIKRAVNQASVSIGNLKELSIPLPPMSAQRRIVAILDQADALRKKRAEADAKAARILPALFYKMFGDPIITINTERWPLKRIDTVADISYGLADRLDTSLKAEEGTRIITISNVTINGEVNNAVERYTKADNAMLKKARVMQNDLLFNWRNGSKEHIGKTAIWENNWPGDVLHVSFLLRIRAHKEQIEPYYLWVLINLLRSGGFFTAQSRMQINNKFNASELSALIIPVPPQKLQSIFKEKLLFLRETARMNTAASLKINNLFDTLLYSAFTGDLTAKWREAHMKELLTEMEIQTKLLNHS